MATTRCRMTGEGLRDGARHGARHRAPARSAAIVRALIERSAAGRSRAEGDEGRRIEGFEALRHGAQLAAHGVGVAEADEADAVLTVLHDQVRRDHGAVHDPRGVDESEGLEDAPPHPDGRAWLDAGRIGTRHGLEGVLEAVGGAKDHRPRAGPCAGLDVAVGDGLGEAREDRLGTARLAALELLQDVPLVVEEREIGTVAEDLQHHALRGPARALRLVHLRHLSVGQQPPRGPVRVADGEPRPVAVGRGRVPGPEGLAIGRRRHRGLVDVDRCAAVGAEDRPGEATRRERPVALRALQNAFHQQILEPNAESTGGCVGRIMRKARALALLAAPSISLPSPPAATILGWRRSRPPGCTGTRGSAGGGRGPGARSRWCQRRRSSSVNPEARSSFVQVSRFMIVTFSSSRRFRSSSTMRRWRSRNPVMRVASSWS